MQGMAFLPLKVVTAGNVSLPLSERQVFGADLNCSELRPGRARQPTRPGSSRRRSPTSFQGRYGADPRDKGVKIDVRHLAEIFLARHGELELAAIAADPLRECPLNVRIADGADALRRVRRDV
jgi:hypothetical protein